MRTWKRLVVLVCAVCLLSAVAAGQAKLLRHPSYSNGKVAFSYLGDIWVANDDGSNVQRLTVHKARDVYPRFSPDGKWMLYISDESGKDEAYVVPFPGPGGKWQVSSGGAAVALWNPAGGEIFYLAPDLTVMSVEVKAGAAGFEAGVPKPLFKAEGSEGGEVSPDGQRFLVIVRPEGTKTPSVMYISNWPGALKK